MFRDGVAWMVASRKVVTARVTRVREDVGGDIANDGLGEWNKEVT